MIKANEAKAIVERVIKEKAEAKKARTEKWCEELSEKIVNAAKEARRNLVTDFPFDVHEEIVDILTANEFIIKQIPNQFKFEIRW